MRNWIESFHTVDRITDYVHQSSFNLFAYRHSDRASGGELEKSQVSLIFGQMNEPPGARASVALSGLTVAESFRDAGKEGEKRAGFDHFAQQIVTFTGTFTYSGKYRRPCGTYALRRWFPAYTGNRNGCDAGTYHVYP